MNSSNSYKPKSTGRSIDRRNFLWRSGGGLGGIALSGMLGRDGVLANTKETLHPVGLHHAPKAKRVIQLFMGGAASHVDLFDFKPELIKRHGEKWDPGETIELFQSSPEIWIKQHGSRDIVTLKNIFTYSKIFQNFYWYDSFFCNNSE